jgi:exopolysaccharide biosynthesis polyprenyl glycosylphosphotransferase
MKNLFHLNPPVKKVDAEFLKDESGLLYSEEFFQEILQLERKRSSRTGIPFLLVLMHLSSHFEHPASTEIVRSIALLLKETTRETDIKGWFKERSTIGILFTELNESKDRMIGIFRERVEGKIREILHSCPGHTVEISFNWFPEEAKVITRQNGENLVFYPELKEDGKMDFRGFLKRAIDIAGSLLGLLMFSPLFLIIPLCIKATSSGPVFFRQERLGLHGRKFNFLKFRSMYVDNSDDIHRNYVKGLINGNGLATVNGSGAPEKVFKLTGDPRITPFGNFLRKSSLDELPQFINVLKGDMSLVGPRPPIPYEFDDYKVWHRKRVVEVKPGITGLWQVKGRSSCSFDEMVRLDLRYIQEWSIWLDIKILIQTPWAVLRGKGAY